MRQSAITLLALCFALCLPCCNLSELSDPIIASDVADEFYVDLWENLHPDGRSLELRFSTINAEPCENARIDFLFQRLGNRIGISLRDIVRPGDCVPGESSAKAVAQLGTLPIGFYELTLDLKKTVLNRGQLTVSTDRYVIDMRTRAGMVFRYPELRSVPPGAIWGYVAFDHSADNTTARRFVDELAQLGEPRAFTPGYYGYFQMYEPSIVAILFDRPRQAHHHPFIYHFEGETKQLTELIDAYREQYSERLTIKLFTSKGEIF